jgi:hypothetical protein
MLIEMMVFMGRFSVEGFDGQTLCSARAARASRVRVDRSTSCARDASSVATRVVGPRDAVGVG